MILLNKVRKLINENQDLFIALEELDRTGKLRKIRYKGRYNFTLDEELMSKFKKYCKEHNVKMSNKIEELISKIFTTN